VDGYLTIDGKSTKEDGYTSINDVKWSPKRIKVYTNKDCIDSFNMEPVVSYNLDRPLDADRLPTFQGSCRTFVEGNFTSYTGDKRNRGTLDISKLVYWWSNKHCQFYINTDRELFLGSANSEKISADFEHISTVKYADQYCITYEDEDKNQEKHIFDTGYILEGEWTKY
jgi:hypothetical protein